jgi:hypothetical protein
MHNQQNGMAQAVFTKDFINLILVIWHTDIWSTVLSRFIDQLTNALLTKWHGYSCIFKRFYQPNISHLADRHLTNSVLSSFFNQLTNALSTK